MRSTLYRLICCAALTIGTASCSQPQDRDERHAESAGATSPDISLAAAPGVSLNYSYRFRLPDGRISATQEAHAAACEALGLAKCRITGMSYSLGHDDDVTAELAVKLDPAIARAFGKSAAALVERNDGRLDALEIGSQDEGAKISDAGRERAALLERIARIEAELAKARPAERAGLIQQLDELRGEANRQAQIASESQAALVTTPMDFTYYGQGGEPGFRGNPLREAWRMFLATIVGIIAFALRALAVLVPLALALVLLVLLWRSRPSRRFRRWLWEDGGEEPNDAGAHSGQP